MGGVGYLLMLAYYDQLHNLGVYSPRKFLKIWLPEVHQKWAMPCPQSYTYEDMYAQMY